MSRQEADREDLLREATALVERVEILLPGCADSVVAGFRRDGSASFFFGADPVYQFNSARELRRAFAEGKLLKAEGGQLVALDRQRTEHQVQLVRNLLDTGETAALLDDATRRLDGLAAALVSGTFSIVGQVSPRGDAMERVSEWLASRSVPPRIAKSPHAR